MRRLSVVLLAMLALLILTTSATADTEPRPDVELQGCESVSASATGWEPSATVTVAVKAVEGGAVVGGPVQTDTDDKGTWQVVVPLDDDIPDGRYVVVARADGTARVSAQFTITGCGPVTPGPTTTTSTTTTTTVPGPTPTTVPGALGPVVVVPAFTCQTVTIQGAGQPQTEASVEVAVRRAGTLVAGPVQVQPTAAGVFGPVELGWGSPPAAGSYVAVVLVDSIERGRSAAFTVGASCLGAATPRTGAGALPFTGLALLPQAVTALALLAGGGLLLRRTRYRSRH
jgi:hypothetical protein